MKKISIIVLVIIFLGMLLTSCKTAKLCPAYGEAKKYRIEKPY